MIIIVIWLNEEHIKAVLAGGIRQTFAGEIKG